MKRFAVIALAVALAGAACSTPEQADPPLEYFTTRDLSFLSEGLPSEGAKAWPGNGCKEFEIKLKIALLSPLNPGARVPVPIQPEMFTTTPLYLDYIRGDPLRLTSATVRFFWQSHRLDKYVDSNIAGNRLPVQLFLAGKDTIIDNDGVLEVLRQGQVPGLDVLWYEDQTHSIQLDAPQRLVEDMSDWIRNHSEMP